MKIWLHQKDPL
jgi:hypothetical protein